MADVMTIDRWLKQARKAHDLTQKELAQRIGCSVRLIEKLERGERRPSRQIADLLAEAFGIPPEQRETFLRFARFGAPEATLALSRQENYAPWRTDPGIATVPTAHTSFVGREEQVQSLVDLLWGFSGDGRDSRDSRDNRGRDGSDLRESARLVTVTGPPGIGKTRLALEVAQRLRAGFTDGVYFVPLDSVRQPSEALPAIAEALRLHIRGDGPLFEAVCGYLADKHLLLVLDTIEHVVTAGSAIAGLLERCPKLSAIVTSRELLHLSMEHELRLPPLAVPCRRRYGADEAVSVNEAAITEAQDTEYSEDGNGSGSLPRPLQDPLLADIAAAEAVRLFVQRAEQVAPGFSLTRENAPIVAEICERLEGLPLAIELAAARVRGLSPATILSRLDSQLSLLTRGPKDLLARLQTLRNAIDSSYTLLDEEEKALFRQLSVFSGGFTLDAVEAVYLGRKSKSAASQTHVLDLVEALMSKSLLQDGRQEGAHRVTMLEALREYGLERLRELGERGEEGEEEGEEQEARYRHARFYTELAEYAQRILRTTQQAAWLSLLERERENLRAALRWAWESDNSELAVRLVNALWEFWLRRGYWHEGIEQVEYALAHPALAETSPARAQALLGAGFLLYLKVELPLAANRLRESIDKSRSLGETKTLCLALNVLGLVESVGGHKSCARRCHEEALAISRQHEYLLGVAVALYGLSLQQLDSADPVGARQKAEESLRIARQIGDQLGTGYALQALALAELDAGQYASARAHSQEALGLFQGLRAIRGTAHMLQSLAFAELGEGNLPGAVSFFRQSIAAFGEIEYTQFIALSLAGLARVALREERPVRAARLLGAARGVLASLGDPFVPTERIRRDPALPTLREELGEARFARELACGAAMSLAEVGAYVAAWEGTPSGSLIPTQPSG